MAYAEKPVAIAKRSAASRLVTLFALLVFALQGYLVQVHVHGGVTAPQPTHVTAPSHNPVDPYDPASCPLCQEMLHAGVFVMPSMVSLPLQLDWIVFLTSSVIPRPVATERTVSWQSRAPPRR